MNIQVTELISPRPYSYVRLCTSCGCALLPVNRVCDSCGSDELLPSLDLRPILLSRHLRNKILTLIEEATEELIQGELDMCQQQYIVKEYLPFFSRALEEAETATSLRSQKRCSSYRILSCSDSDALEHLKCFRFPPTKNDTEVTQ